MSPTSSSAGDLGREAGDSPGSILKWHHNAVESRYHDHGKPMVNHGKSIVNHGKPMVNHGKPMVNP